MGEAASQGRTLSSSWATYSQSCVQCEIPDITNARGRGCIDGGSRWLDSDWRESEVFVNVIGIAAFLMKCIQLAQETLVKVEENAVLVDERYDYGFFLHVLEVAYGAVIDKTT